MMKIALVIAFGLAVALVDGVSSRAVVPTALIVQQFLRSVAQSGRADDGNANDYVEKMLVNLKDYVKKNMEPLVLGPQGEDIKGLSLDGLSTIFRSGDATIRHEGQTILLAVNLGFNQLRGVADIEKNLFWEIWVTGTAEAKIRGLSLYGEVRIDLVGSAKPVLEKLLVKNWGDMETSFQGNNWLGVLAQFVSGQFPGIMDNILKSNLEGWMKQGIEYVLDNIDFTLG